MAMTFFIDLDGTLLFDHGTEELNLQAEPRALPGSIVLLERLKHEGHRVILVTGRAKSATIRTAEQLRLVGIATRLYDRLIMDVGKGHRVVINDSKPSEPVGTKTAQAYTVQRNEGVIGLFI